MGQAEVVWLYIHYSNKNITGKCKCTGGKHLATLKIDDSIRPVPLTVQLSYVRVSCRFFTWHVHHCCRSMHIPENGCISRCFSALVFISITFRIDAVKSNCNVCNPYDLICNASWNSIYCFFNILFYCDIAHITIIQLTCQSWHNIFVLFFFSSFTPSELRKKKKKTVYNKIKK